MYQSQHEDKIIHNKDTKWGKTHWLKKYLDTGTLSFHINAFTVSIFLWLKEKVRGQSPWGNLMLKWMTAPDMWYS